MGYYQEFYKVTKEYISKRNKKYIEYDIVSEFIKPFIDYNCFEFRKVVENLNIDKQFIYEYDNNIKLVLNKENIEKGKKMLEQSLKEAIYNRAINDDEACGIVERCTYLLRKLDEILLMFDFSKYFILYCDSI